MKIGVIVNPIAGVGAALAWKGTDDIDRAWDVVLSGGNSPVWDILRRAIASVDHSRIVDPFQWFYAGLAPKYSQIFSGSVTSEIVYEMPIHSTPKDTHDAVAIMLEKEMDIIVFVGGDGTALDVSKIVQGTIPILGVPGGVKIFSAAFLHRPEDLGRMLRTWTGETMEIELIDLDEEEYRQGRAQPTIVGNCIIPLSDLTQNSKESWSNSDDDDIYEMIAERVKEERLLENKSILVGAGSTMKKIFKFLGMDISLLGVDIISNGQLSILDATQSQIDNHLKQYGVDEIWLSPIGNQGHIIGRGNRQISTSVIQSVGKARIKIFSTTEKIMHTPLLYVDTGDPELDQDLLGYCKVLVGYHDEIVRKISN